MPRFEPFQGLRYDAGRVDLDAVISPPYDVVNREQREHLAARHSVNSVQLELPEPDHRAGLDRYQHAAQLWTDWQQQGILQPDAGPAFYAYRMTTPEGRATNGVIGALGLDREQLGEILPHEQILPKPASDRLDLLRATRANLSPIWGLSMTHGLTETFLPEGAPDAQATDDDGVVHALWVLDDPATAETVGGAVAASPVVVADGHHRYQTALNYAAERSGAGGATPGDEAVMALVVELSEHELAVGPIHRTLSGLPDGLDLVDAFSSWFDVTRAGDFDERTLGALGSASALALVMESGAWLLTPKDGTPEAAGSDLDSSMTALVFAELPEHELRFYADWRDAVAAVEDEAQAAVLLRPVTVAQIEEWARADRRMPPKSTYFFPKPRTGMVFRSLDLD